VNTLLLNNHLEQSIETANLCVYWKDKQGKYLGVNNKYLLENNMKSQKDVIGKNDNNFVWEENAPKIMAHDKEVMLSRKKHIYFEVIKAVSGDFYRNYLSYKIPLLSRSGKIIGIFGMSLLLNENNAIDFNNINGDIVSLFIGGVSTRSELILPTTKLQSFLTQRQEQCLYFMAKGMTMKQIAHAIGLSPKTVEHHIDALKIKLNCFSRSALIAKAFELGIV